jgi:hypothetical protein
VHAPRLVEPPGHYGRRRRRARPVRSRVATTFASAVPPDGDAPRIRAAFELCA